MFLRNALAIIVVCLFSVGGQATQQHREIVFDAGNFLADCDKTTDELKCRSEQERWLENATRAMDGDGRAQIEMADCLYDNCEGAIDINLEESCAWELVRFRRVIFVEKMSEASPFILLKGACRDLYATKIPNDSVERKSKNYYWSIYKVLHRGIDTVF